MAVLEVPAAEQFAVACINAPGGLLGTITVAIKALDGTTVVAPSTAGISESGDGDGLVYTATLTASEEPGDYLVVWDTGDGTIEEKLIVTPALAVDDAGVLPAIVGLGAGPDLRDLSVLIPRARRTCEGPYGSPPGRPELTDSYLYAAVADACGQVILFTGTLFGHELEVKQRDPVAGYPTEWRTSSVLSEWEGALIITQLALDYFFFLFRDMKISESIKNEGTEWAYSISANVIKNYMETLQAQRDKALEGLRAHRPVYDTYVSNIRVRDQATVAILEWWDTNSPGLGGGVGVPGGQEAAVIPWTPGWSGPGFIPG